MISYLAILLIVVFGVIGTLISTMLRKPIIGGIFKNIASLVICIFCALDTSIFIFERIVLVISSLLLLTGDITLSILRPLKHRELWLKYGNRASQAGYLFLAMAMMSFVPEHADNIVILASMAGMFSVGLLLTQFIDIRLIGKALPIFAIYLTVISFLVIVAILTGNRLVFVGACLIYLSDAIIAYTKFGRHILFTHQGSENLYCISYYAGLASIMTLFI